MKYSSLLSLYFVGALKGVAGDAGAEVTLSTPKDAAEESLNTLLGEIMTNHNQVASVKNKTIPQPKQQQQQQDTADVEEFNKMNRDEQESNCILLAAVGDRIPDSENICTCSSETDLDLTCDVTGACSGGSNNVCADATEVHMDLNSGLAINYCSEFSSDYEDTCVNLLLNNAGDRVESCEAYYGGSQCNCYACGDQTSITVDCTRFNCRATTNGCQAIDLASQQLVTVVPDFQPNDWVCPTPAPVALPPTQPPVAPTPPATPDVSVPRPGTGPPPTPPSTGGGSSPSPPSPPATAVVIPTLPPNPDQSCTVFPILAEQVPDADQFCYCGSDVEVNCIFEGGCGENGLCADYSDLSISLATGLPTVDFCVNFVDDHGYEDTCVNMGINFDQTVSSCNEATYGGQPCECTLCDDAVSLIVDCSAYDPGATTNGCQSMPEELGPMIPAFEYRTGFGGSTGGGGGGGGGGSAVDCTIQPKGEPRPPPEGPQDCFLYTMLTQEVPDFAEWCVCDGETAINCFYDHVCTDGVCADQMNAVASIDNGNNAETCIIFSDDRFEETCVSIAVNLDQTLMGCNYATYGGEDCVCSLCDDGVSMTVDCSMHNEFAITECQSMQGVEPAVLNFKYPPDENCVDGGSSGGGGGGAMMDDDFVAEPFPPAGADQSCQIMALGSAQLPQGSPPLEDFCYCDTATSLACRFYDTCADHGLCANQVDTGLDIGSGAPKASYCTLFKGNIFEETCVELEVDFSQNIQSCDEATYGGRPCECTVCDDMKSLIIDCSMHDPDATTITCQGTPDEIGPVIPAFQHDGGSSGGGGGMGPGNDLSDCRLINILEGRLENPEQKCECMGTERVDCVEEDYCYTSRLTESSTCAESVDISIDTTQGVAITHCTTFDEERNGYDFEVTCVEVSVGIDLELEECLEATYGGQTCTCNVCEDSNAVEIDCTEHDENAWIPCQPLDMQESLTPFVPHFMGSVDGSNENLQRAGCSGAAALSATVATVLGIFIASLYMI